MAASLPRNSAARRRVLPALASSSLLLFAATLAGAAAPAPAEPPYDWGADVLNSNLRTDVHELSGNVRVSQGPMSIESEQATAKAVQTDHSQWTFERAVHIKTAEADLRSNSASAEFVKGLISQARATGTPAYFEQLGGPPDKQVKGRAGIIEYDFDKGIVKLSNDVWFSYGGNEFRSSKVIYNLREERVVANPDRQDSGRVNITVRPKSGDVKLDTGKPVKDPGKDDGKPKKPDGKNGAGA